MKQSRRTFFKLGLAVAAAAAVPKPLAAFLESKKGSWLVCDGSHFYEKEFPELFQVIGNRYGYGVLPDLTSPAGPNICFKEPFRFLIKARSDSDNQPVGTIMFGGTLPWA